MMDNTIAQQAPPAEVYLTPVSLDVARFVGDTVLVPARHRACRAKTALGELPAQDPTSSGASGVLVFRPGRTCRSPGTALYSRTRQSPR